MSMISIFVIVLIAAFATIAYFTEPSEAEKRVHQRLSTLGRPVMQGEEDQQAARSSGRSRSAVSVGLIGTCGRADQPSSCNCGLSRPSWNGRWAGSFSIPRVACSWVQLSVTGGSRLAL